MHWREAIAQWARAVEPHAARPVHLQIGPPAEPRQLRELEAELARPLPAIVARFLTEQTSEIAFAWWLRPDLVPLDVPNRPNSGAMMFRIDMLAKLVRLHERSLNRRPLRGDAREGRSAFPFLGVPNGDVIALDREMSESNPPVIYLNHEQPEKYLRLAESFDHFIAAWLGLGCVGPEHWILHHFMTDGGRPLTDHTDGTPTSRLDPTCPNARQFRAFFGMA